MRSPISTPQLPAFIRIAPPTVPGMPVNASRPLRAFFSQKRSRRESPMPASAMIVCPLTLISPKPRERFIRGSRTPLSVTRRLVPLPRMRAVYPVLPAHGHHDPQVFYPLGIEDEVGRSADPEGGDLAHGDPVPDIPPESLLFCILFSRPLLIMRTAPVRPPRWPPIPPIYSPRRGS